MQHKFGECEINSLQVVGHPSSFVRCEKMHAKELVVSNVYKKLDYLMKINHSKIYMSETCHHRFVGLNLKEKTNFDNIGDKSDSLLVVHVKIKFLRFFLVEPLPVEKISKFAYLNMRS